MNVSYCKVGKLIPEFIVTHPRLDLLVGHIEIAFLLIQGSDLFHLVVGKREAERFDILPDMSRIGRAGDHAESFLQMPANDCIA